MKTKRLFIIGYKSGKKVCEADITSYTIDQAKKLIKLQEMQGRHWDYEGRTEGGS